MKKLLCLLMLTLLMPTANAMEIKGIVLDGLDNLVGYADIKLDCIEDETFSTDKFGTFIIKDVPEEECKIYANYKDAIGFKELKPNQTNIEIKLDKTIINIEKEDNYIWLIFIATLLVILYLKFRKKQRKPKKTNKRTSDILKTLNSNEQKIVNLLIENKTMSQSNIRHELKIPRTTLSRVLQSLEKKNIIEIQKTGKIVKVSLTRWFLGKN